MFFKPLPAIIGMLFFITSLSAQNKPASVDKLVGLPTAFINKVSSKYTRVGQNLSRQTEVYLQRQARKEKKMKRKLAKVDSTKAGQVFGNIDAQYDQLIASLHNDSLKQNHAYIPTVDSIKTSLLFLSQHSSLPASELTASINRVDHLQGTLQQSEMVRSFIQQRKQMIRESLKAYVHLPAGIRSEWMNYQKEAYYYSAQLKEYKEVLNDPGKMMKKGLSMLNQLPAFQQFMKHYSELSNLFPVPDNYGTPQSLAGLQTRVDIQQQLQGQLLDGGPNAQQYLKQNLQIAQSKIGNQKDNPDSDADLPDFKPNSQRTKTFWQRLEYGTDFQTARNNFYPTTTDLGLSVGYKLNDKNTIGVGASYKLGWGTDIRHIHITSQGAGIRSFLDVKLKGSFFATGGFEYNYQAISASLVTANPTMHLDDLSSWQKSGLIGISKIISIKSEFFKKTKVQLLWDFLSYQQVPKTQPLKFRIGYVYH